MSRDGSVILWFVLVVALLLPASAASAACGDVVGDVNGNGTLNITDAQCVVLMTIWEIGGSVPGTQPACLSGPTGTADLDCDGSINVADAQIVVTLVVQNPLSSIIDGDGDGCPDGCQTTQLAGPPIVVPTWFVGTASGGGLQLRALAPGFVAEGKASGGGLTLEPKPVGKTTAN